MINNVTLMGRLTKPPELRQTPNGISVVTFSLAVERNYKPQNGEKETDFINCVAWRQTADFIHRYFGKGDMIAITGEIQTRKYTDASGTNRTVFEVMANQASFCGGKNSASDPAITTQAPNDFEVVIPTLATSADNVNSTFTTTVDPLDELDDLPF